MLALEEVRALHQAIGLVVILPLADGSLSVAGPTPNWLRRLGGGELTSTDHTLFPLLESFLPDATEFWNAARPGRLRSGIFTVTDDTGEECHLEISALSLGPRHVLILDLLNQDYIEMQAVYQKAREGFLLYKKSLQTETSLRAAKALAESTTQATSETLANWGDEMRRPLNAIVGSAEVLTEQQLSGAQREMVGVIRRNAEQLLVLIKNVLDYTKEGADQS